MISLAHELFMSEHYPRNLKRGSSLLAVSLGEEAIRSRNKISTDSQIWVDCGRFLM